MRARNCSASTQASVRSSPAGPLTWPDLGYGLGLIYYGSRSFGFLALCLGGLRTEGIIMEWSERTERTKTAHLRQL